MRLALGRAATATGVAMLHLRFAATSQLCVSATSWRPALAASSSSASSGIFPLVPHPRHLHSSVPLRQLLDAQTLKQAAAWNLAARLASDAEELDGLGSWLRGFKRDDIPADSFELKHARSSGAGGQNVNKGHMPA